MRLIAAVFLTTSAACGHGQTEPSVPSVCCDTPDCDGVRSFEADAGALAQSGGSATDAVARRLQASLRDWLLPEAGESEEEPEASGDASHAAPVRATAPDRSWRWVPQKPSSWACRHKPMDCPRGYWVLPDGDVIPPL